MMEKLKKKAKSKTKNLSYYKIAIIRLLRGKKKRKKEKKKKSILILSMKKHRLSSQSSTNDTLNCSRAHALFVLQ